MTYQRVGKTTRMLMLALRSAETGDNGFVVGATAVECKRLLRQTQMLCEALHPPLTVKQPSQDTLEIGEHGGSLIFVPPYEPKWDWMTGRFRGTDHTSPVFIDHYAQELHRNR